MIRRSMVSFAAALAVVAGSASAATVTLTATLDNTLYEDAGGGLSNAIGPNLFAGQTRFNGVRRALVRFDISSIPSGATVTGATLTLTLTNSINTGDTQTVHRVLATWGEGTSDTGPDNLDPGGSGTFSTPGDATWAHRFFSATPWATLGGDFAATPSASATINGPLIPVSWSSATLASDVQGWVNTPSSNAGWLIKGVEGAGGNAKRYASRENPDSNLRPKLVVTFTPPPCLGDLNNDGFINTADLTIFLGNFGQSVPPGTLGDLDNSGTVNTADLTIFLGRFGVPC